MTGRNLADKFSASSRGDGSRSPLWVQPRRFDTQHEVCLTRQQITRGLPMNRWAVHTMVGALGLGLLVSTACGGDEPRKKQLTDGCIANSDCAGSLTCTFGHCHEPCDTSKDCPSGARCVEADDGTRVCQLPAEEACGYNSDCTDPLTCAPDGECRNECRTDRDCVSGQTCTVSKVCADEAEVDGDDALIGAGGASASEGDAQAGSSQEGGGTAQGRRDSGGKGEGGAGPQGLSGAAGTAPSGVGAEGGTTGGEAGEGGVAGTDATGAAGKDSAAGSGTGGEGGAAAVPFWETDCAADASVASSDRSLPVGVVAYYRFDEGASSAQSFRDLSGNCQDLVLGATDLYDAADPAFSDTSVLGEGYGASFDGINDQAWRVAGPAFLPEELTLSAAVRLRSATLRAGKRQVLISTLAAECSGGGYELSVRGSALDAPEIVFSYRPKGSCTPNEVAFDLTTLAYYAEGTKPEEYWYNVTATYERPSSGERRLRLYVLGELVAEATFDSAMDTTGVTRFVLGASPEAVASGQEQDERFSGILDEVLVFGRALGPADVAELYTTTQFPGPGGFFWFVWHDPGSTAIEKGPTSTELVAASLVDGIDGKAGLWGGLLDSGGVVDLSSYDELVLDADIPSGTLFQVELARADAWCEWLVIGQGSAEYRVSLHQPRDCGGTCPFDFRAWSVGVTSHYALDQDVEVLVRDVALVTTGDGVGSSGPAGGLVGPGGWCWRPAAYYPEDTARWEGTPSSVAVSAYLEGPAESSPVLTAQVPSGAADGAGALEIDATVGEGTLFSVKLGDTEDAWCEWMYTGTGTAATYASDLSVPDWCDNETELDLTKLSTLHLSKPWSEATSIVITVTDVRFVPWQSGAIRAGRV
jgi:hypothetical protein